MEDGISITGLTIGGAALTTLGGLAGAWVKARWGQTRIAPQPLEVRAAPRLVTCDECRQRHDEVDRRHESLSGEVHSERFALGEALNSIRTKLDTIDSKAEERSRNLHKRIDPLVAAMGDSKASIDNHIADHRAGVFKG